MNHMSRPEDGSGRRAPSAAATDTTSHQQQAPASPGWPIDVQQAHYAMNHVHYNLSSHMPTRSGGYYVNGMLLPPSPLPSPSSPQLPTVSDGAFGGGGFEPFIEQFHLGHHEPQFQDSAVVVDAVRQPAVVAPSYHRPFQPLIQAPGNPPLQGLEGIHIGNSGYRCFWNGCTISSGFTNQDLLWEHVHSAHYAAGGLECGWGSCQTRSLSARSSLRRHILDLHVYPDRFECTHPGCNKRFGRKDKRDDHARTDHSR